MFCKLPTLKESFHFGPSYLHPKKRATGNHASKMIKERTQRNKFRYLKQTISHNELSKPGAVTQTVLTEIFLIYQLRFLSNAKSIMQLYNTRKEVIMCAVAPSAVISQSLL